MGRITYDEEDGLVIEASDGNVVEVATHRNAGGYFASLKDLFDVSVSDVRFALTAAQGAWNVVTETWGSHDVAATILLSSLPDNEIDTKYTPHLDVWLNLTGSEHVEGVVAFSVEGEEWTSDSVRRLTEPLLVEVGAEFIDAVHYDEGPIAGGDWLWRLHFRPRLDSLVADVVSLGRSAAALIEVADRGTDLDAKTALRIVRGGLVRALLGQPESDWLEAKARLWDLDTVAGRIELAQDVSRFANGSSDALLLVGVATKKRSGVDVLTQGPGDVPRKAVERVHKTIDARVHPPIDGLELSSAPDGVGGEVLAVFIPAQLEELKPFIVHGAVVDGRVEGGFFSIVRRRGEHSIPVTPQSLHSMIAAGRALLRGTRDERNDVELDDEL